MYSTPAQDAKRRMKEIIAQASEQSRIISSDSGPMLPAYRQQFVDDLLKRFSDNLCIHADTADVGSIEVFLLASAQGLFCEDCIPPLSEISDYQQTTDCDWCQKQSYYFTEVIITLETIALHVWANVCDKCMDILNPPVLA